MATSQEKNFMVSSKGFGIPEFHPQPRVVECSPEDSQLAVDVRLVTMNVLPLQRKAIRSILTAAGVRVVANKKTYVVTASVEDPERFDLSGVPEAVRNDYYELRVSGSEVFLRSPYQDGMVWAAQTLSVLFKQAIAGKKIPNQLIKDWPELPVRGLVILPGWGPDRMSMYDWSQAIDCASAMKMNTICLSFYGCLPDSHYDGSADGGEFLLFPIGGNENEEGGQAAYRKEQRLRWYYAGGDFWHDETYVPTLTQNNLLPDVITYGHERGVNIVPMVSCLGENTLFSRLHPEISAVQSRKKPSEKGLCLTSEATRNFLTQTYGELLQRYYPNGTEYFHVRMDAESLACKCAACSKMSDDERQGDYLLWLVKMLVSKGVEKVVVWSDFLTSHPGLFCADFVKRLKSEGVFEHLVLQYWSPQGHKLEATALAAIRKFGFKLWSGSLFGRNNWVNYENYQQEVEASCQQSVVGGLSGGLVCGTWDPSYADQLAILSGYGWQGGGDGKVPVNYRKQWAQVNFGAGAESYLKTVDALAKLSHDKILGLCTMYQYTLGAWRPYPETALSALSELKNVEASLSGLQKSAKELCQGFAKFRNNEALSSLLKEGLDSFEASALRIKMLAQVFEYLLNLRQGLDGGAVKKVMLNQLESLRSDFLADMKEYEKLLPPWMVQASIQPFTYLLIFLDQLSADLKGILSRKKETGVRWTLDEDWQVPAN